MPTQITSALRRLAIAIREFTVAQRTLAIIGTAVLVVGVAALGFWLTRPVYSPLFSGLSGEDASAIVDQPAPQPTSAIRAPAFSSTA